MLKLAYPSPGPNRPAKTGEELNSTYFGVFGELKLSFIFQSLQVFYLAGVAGDAKRTNKAEGSQLDRVSRQFLRLYRKP